MGLEERVRSLEVRQSMTEQRQDTMGQDLKEIKNILKWLNYLALGALFTAMLNLVIKVGG